MRAIIQIESGRHSYRPGETRGSGDEVEVSPPPSSHTLTLTTKCQPGYLLAFVPAHCGSGLTANLHRTSAIVTTMETDFIWFLSMKIA